MANVLGKKDDRVAGKHELSALADGTTVMANTARVLGGKMLAMRAVQE